jgi:hypothetical protein
MRAFSPLSRANRWRGGGSARMFRARTPDRSRQEADAWASRAVPGVCSPDPGGATRILGPRSIAARSPACPAEPIDRAAAARWLGPCRSSDADAAGPSRSCRHGSRPHQTSPPALPACPGIGEPPAEVGRPMLASVGPPTAARPNTLRPACSGEADATASLPPDAPRRKLRGVLFLARVFGPSLWPERWDGVVGVVDRELRNGPGTAGPVVATLGPGVAALGPGRCSGLSPSRCPAAWLGVAEALPPDVAERGVAPSDASLGRSAGSDAPARAEGPDRGPGSRGPAADEPEFIGSLSVQRYPDLRGVRCARLVKLGRSPSRRTRRRPTAAADRSEHQTRVRRRYPRAWALDAARVAAALATLLGLWDRHASSRSGCVRWTTSAASPRPCR